MRQQLAHRGVSTPDDAIHHAMDVLEHNKNHSYYRSIVVDEGQDFGVEAMTLLRRLTPEQADDLFIVGDGHQRKTTLSQCGINIRGRGKKLRINYRTTEQIRRFATGLLEGVPVDDLDDGSDSCDDYRSLVQGAKPLTFQASSFDEECRWLTEQLNTLSREGFNLADCCLVTRTQFQLGEYEQAIAAAGIEICRLSRTQSDDRNKPGLRLATMHRVKGLEFRIVLMAGINKGVVPLQRAVSSTDDPVERHLKEVNGRGLFHVAATRAIQILMVSCYGKASPFMDFSG